jgi:hypothetical protein
MKHRNRITSAVALLIALALVGGCAKTSQTEATGKGTIRGINAIVTAPDLSFLIEERSLGSVTFKGVAGFNRYDDLSYNFNFDIQLPGTTSLTRLATEFIDVVADTEYTLVLTGSVANPTIMRWEEPERTWAETETVFEADFVHLSPEIGEVDVYFAPVGIAPTLGSAIGTLNYGDRIPYAEFQDAQFQIFVTPKDDVDPLNYLYQSAIFSSSPGTRVTFALFDPDPSITADIAVNLISASGGSTSIPDITKPAVIRLLHAAIDIGRVDGFFNSDFATNVFPDVGFGEVSAYTDIGTIATTVTLTDLGNTGAIVHEEEISGSGNSKRTIVLGGASSTLLFKGLRDEGRPLETNPVMRITNTSLNSDVVTIYLLDPGTPITADERPVYAGLPVQVDTGFFGIESGIRELTITSFGTIEPISTPITIDVTNGDFADIVILDNVDPGVVDVVIFDSNLP